MPNTHTHHTRIPRSVTQQRKRCQEFEWKFLSISPYAIIGLLPLHVDRVIANNIVVYTTSTSNALPKNIYWVTHIWFELEAADNDWNLNRPFETFQIYFLPLNSGTMMNFVRLRVQFSTRHKIGRGLLSFFHFIFFSYCWFTLINWTDLPSVTCNRFFLLCFVNFCHELMSISDNSFCNISVAEVNKMTCFHITAFLLFCWTVLMYISISDFDSSLNS